MRNWIWSNFLESSWARSDFGFCTPAYLHASPLFWHPSATCCSLRARAKLFVTEAAEGAGRRRVLSVRCIKICCRSIFCTWARTLRGLMMLIWCVITCLVQCECSHWKPSRAGWPPARLGAMRNNCTRFFHILQNERVMKFDAYFGWLCDSDFLFRTKAHVMIDNECGWWAINNLASVCCV